MDAGWPAGDSGTNGSLAVSVHVTLCWLDATGVRQAQRLVTDGHYLHRPVDARSSPQGYAVEVMGALAGVLLFGRPQATVTRPWYGSVAEVQSGRVAVTRWQVLNLARVYLLPQVQAGGVMCIPELLPGYVDRRGVWRSTLASTAISLACERVVLDYLLARPPVFLDEPYEIRWILSYCDRRLHRGVVYRESGFQPYWRRGEDLAAPIWTFRRQARPLTAAEHGLIRRASADDPRARTYRGRRSAAAFEQRDLFEQRQEAWG